MKTEFQTCLLREQKGGGKIFMKSSNKKQTSYGKQKLLLKSFLISVLRKLSWEAETRTQTVILWDNTAVQHAEKYILNLFVLINLSQNTASLANFLSNKIFLIILYYSFPYE
jgi:hypothetical protein